MISLQEVSRSFQVGVEVVRAVDNVDFHAEPGSMTCIYGASGSGKSTLLNLIAGLDIPDHGLVRVAGSEISAMPERGRAKVRLRSVGVVFQENNLIGEFTAGENVLLPLLSRGMPYAEAKLEAAQSLKHVGIDHLFDRAPKQMSGGQRQRVGIARALAGGREVLVADEPTGALDSSNSDALFRLISEMCHQHGATAVVATHDTLARSLADVVWTMHDGRLLQP